ncbi:hypothetical protein AVEN_80732-1, partial [Araneus ventricosus]
EAEKFCSDCKVSYKTSSIVHERSIAHLLVKSKSDLSTFYHIPENNKGFQIMLKSGWDKNKGLGPNADGRKFPIKTVFKQDRSCIGKNKEVPKVTHFNANDETAVETKKCNPVTDSQSLRTLVSDLLQVLPSFEFLLFLPSSRELSMRSCLRSVCFLLSWTAKYPMCRAWRSIRRWYILVPGVSIGWSSHLVGLLKDQAKGSPLGLALGGHCPGVTLMRFLASTKKKKRTNSPTKTNNTIAETISRIYTTSHLEVPNFITTKDNISTHQSALKPSVIAKPTSVDIELLPMAVLPPLEKKILQSRESDADAEMSSSSASEEDALEYNMSEDLEDSPAVISPPPSSKPEKANKYKNR